MNTYTGNLTGNRRGVGTTTPKVLITGINPDSELARNHCWVDITPAIEQLIPHGSANRTVEISFSAKLKPYKNYLTGEVKYTLHKITNISIA